MVWQLDIQELPADGIADSGLCLSQTKKTQYRNDDNHGSDQPNDVVHDVLLIPRADTAGDAAPETKH